MTDFKENGMNSIYNGKDNFEVEDVLTPETNLKAAIAKGDPGVVRKRNTRFSVKKFLIERGYKDSSVANVMNRFEGKHGRDVYKLRPKVLARFIDESFKK